MTDVRERATPTTTKRDRHAGGRPLRRLEDATASVAPLRMPARRPFPLEWQRQRLPGRGAAAQRVGGVLALQRTLGNRATQEALANTDARASIQRFPFRKKKKGQKDTRLGFSEQQELLAVGANARALPPGTAKTPAKDRAGTAKEWLEYGEKPLATPSAAFGGFSVAAIKAHEDDDKKYFESSADEDSSVGSASERAGLGSGAAGLGSGASLVAMGGSIATIVKLSKKLKDAKGAKKKTGAALEIGARGMQGLASGGQVATGVGVSVAKGVISDDSKNSAAVDTATIMGGVGNSLAAVGAVFEMLVAGAKGVIGLVKVIRGKAEDKKAAIAKVLENFLSAGKNFLATASSATFATSKFLTYAKHGAEFVQHVPIIGYAIDIAVQALDILDQTVKFVKQVIRMVRAKKYRAKMKEMAASTAKAAEQKLAGFIGEANRKRFRRAIVSVVSNVINILADLVHIGGDIANIVGAATAGAMGAGGGALAAGYGMKAGAGVMKLGAATLKPFAWALRHGKQKIRDSGAKYSSVKKVGGFLGINMTKTSAAKETELDNQVTALLVYVENLKDDLAFRSLTDAEKNQELEKYTHAKNMIKAAGLSPKELVEVASVAEMQDVLKDALRKRD